MHMISHLATGSGLRPHQLTLSSHLPTGSRPRCSWDHLPTDSQIHALANSRDQSVTSALDQTHAPTNSHDPVTSHWFTSPLLAGSPPTDSNSRPPPAHRISNLDTSSISRPTNSHDPFTSPLIHDPTAHGITTPVTHSLIFMPPLSHLHTGSLLIGSPPH